ncbi:TlpA family protein disulfide reductase [Flavobacterium foetidum]|uniref:TlpA family protein disulfide reductase n=1 Tax=Flavobacterium foetidum TaxID=2026681 RepID=UPI001074AA3B|nr:MauE/DoxX family redox-associated membrane protein [Flavobacterium foetidum]KAF2514910.1 hypothetical protein E0W73_10785 [Flavobacterium foetidum]
MKNSLISKSALVIVFSILLGTFFLMSTIGKYFDLNNFKITMLKYGLPYYVSYVILIIEFLFAVSFMFLFYLKNTARLSIVFTILLTIINTIGHFFLKIESCQCFGRIYFLNPDSFSGFLLKNIVITLLSFYIYKNVKHNQNKSLLKTFISPIAILIIAFVLLKYNTYYIENYSEKKIGHPIEELKIDKTKIKNFEYLLFFSPSCTHCKNAIPKINLLKEKYAIAIIGITSNSNRKELKKIKSELKINFPITTVDKKVFHNMTLIVPIIFKIKDNKIQEVLEVKELLEQKNF